LDMDEKELSLKLMILLFIQIFFCFDIMNVVDETLKHIILYLHILNVALY